MIFDRLRPTNEIEQAVAQNRYLFNQGLGLYQPENLYQSLLAIKAGLEGEGNYSSIDAVAYFLGHEIACQVWASGYREPPVAPFIGLEAVTAGIKDAEHVVRVGCPSPGSFDYQKAFFTRAGLNPISQTVIDIAPLPIRRLRLDRPGQAEFVQADANEFPIGSLSPDIIITDLLFSSPSKSSHHLLDRLATAIPDGGHLLTRVCIVPEDIEPDYFRLMDSVGTFWGSFIRREYGVTEDGRDRYLGLTKRQWDGLGLLYSHFVKDTFYGPDRFKSVEDALSFLSSSPNLRLVSTSTLNQPIGRSQLDFVSVALQKLPAKI